HILSAIKHAPGNPDVEYVAAIYAQRENDVAGAIKHLEVAITTDPNHFASQLALGRLMMKQGDAKGAIPHLEKALSIDPDSWTGHWLLAEAYVDNREAAKAKFHAERALQLGKNDAISAEITVARVHYALGEYDAARKGFQDFIAKHPNDQSVPRVKEILATASFKAPAQGPTEMADDALTVRVPLPLEILAASSELLDTAPKNIDAAVPAVTPDAPCSLPQVLDGAGRRMKDFASALERFSATEDILQEDLNAKGIALKSANNSYDYLAALEWPVPDRLVVDESRGDNAFKEGMPAGVVSDGLPAIALIFHPLYQGDFQMSCEGLGQWHGEPAWQIHFEQRDDKPVRMRTWTVGGVTYAVHLKGRAWIDSSSFQ
ncbi:MAG: tetratricopeptide repeat protein, partial [Bryobacteraceae bacterium]